MSNDGQVVDASAVDPQEFARNIAATSDDELREGMRGPLRDQIVAEIFRRMEEHYRPQGALDAVIHWRISGRADGAEDHWEVLIEGESCTASPEPRSDPRVTLKLDGVDFLRLVTGNANGPTLFMAGKLRIEGDLMFSAQIATMFTIPGSGA